MVGIVAYFCGLLPRKQRESAIGSVSKPGILQIRSRTCTISSKRFHREVTPMEEQRTPDMHDGFFRYADACHDVPFPWNVSGPQKYNTPSFAGKTACQEAQAS